MEWATSSAVPGRCIGMSPAASRALGVDASAGPQAMARIESAELAVDNGRATLRPAHDDGPRLLRTAAEGAGTGRGHHGFHLHRLHDGEGLVGGHLGTVLGQPFDQVAAHRRGDDLTRQAGGM